jgi:hypothetical protein
MLLKTDRLVLQGNFSEENQVKIKNFVRKEFEHSGKTDKSSQIEFQRKEN